MNTAIVNGVIVSNGQLLRNKAIIIQNGYFERILNENEIPQGVEIKDMQGAFLAPGFIDLQVMGAGGALHGILPSETSLDIMEKELLKQGTIGFLPTASSNSSEVIKKVVETTVRYRKRALGNFLGLHLEGPYLNPANRGAHPEKYLTKATLQSVNELLDIAQGEIKMMTIAPELQDEPVIKYLLDHSVVLSIGHSGASYDEALNFFAGSRKAVTHLFNGMPPIHHRNPGMIPAIFQKKPYTSIVADGIHVAYPMVKMAKDILGEFLYLITDAATPCTEGVYQYTLKGDRYITMRNNQEVLAGSTLTMLKAVQNCVEYVGISLPEAINMATLYPARVLGMERKNGLIHAGYEAHLVAFDHKYNIKQVIYNGEVVSIHI